MSAEIMVKEQYFTVDGICKLLGFNRKTVIKWITDGELIASRLGREYRIRSTDLDDLMRRKQIKPKDQEK